MEQSFCGQYDAALFFWTKFTGNPALKCTEVRFYQILSDGIIDCLYVSWVINGDDISMAICFDFRPTNVMQMSNQNP